LARFVDITAQNLFDVHGDTTSLGTRWLKWRQGFDLYLVAAGINKYWSKEGIPSP